MDRSLAPHSIGPPRRPERAQDARKPLGRFLMPLAALALLSGLTAPEANAQWTVVDPAHIAKTVWNGRRIVEQVRNQAEQIRNEVEMLRRLPQPPWREIRARVDELEEVMRAGEALAFSMDGLLDEFGVTFPGFRNYADWSAERRAQFDRSLQTLANSLMGLQQQGRQIALSQAELDRIKAMRASGQTSATELGNTIDAFAAEELVLLRQLVAVQANAQAVAAAQRINDEAQRAAAQEERVRGMADYEHPTGRGFTGVLDDDGN
jgi:P-type conjugative transfer protein TrbJ